MADRTSPIGVMDSGVGGISTLGALTRLMPGEHFLFFGDTRYAPYGTKTEEAVRERAEEIVARFRSRDVKAVVIACNTASSAAAAALREKESIPIVAMEPALKPAAQLRHGGVNLVLATPMTLQLPKYRALAAQWGEGAVALPCAGLVELIEREDWEEAERYLRGRFATLKESPIDAVVLGCTHYVFLRPVLRRLLPEKTLILDGNAGTARQLRNVLLQRSLLREEGTGSVSFATSGEESRVLPVMERFYRLACKLAAQEESGTP